MSYRYGFLDQRIDQNNQEIYYGKINSPFFKGEVKFMPEQKYGEGSPDGYIFTRGEEYPIGKYWLKETKRDRTRFLSFELDNPMLDKTIYLSAFMDQNNGGNFSVIWKRNKKINNKSNDSSNNSENNQQIDDAIPF